MTCQKCRLRVENALNAKGNIWASVDLKDGSAVVRMKNKLPDGTLERIVSREGFVVVGIERIR
jgi:copper chaperone CopZ